MSAPETWLRSWGQKGILGRFFLNVKAAIGSMSTKSFRSKIGKSFLSFALRKPSEKPPTPAKRSTMVSRLLGIVLFRSERLVEEEGVQVLRRLVMHSGSHVVHCSGYAVRIKSRFDL